MATAAVTNNFTNGTPADAEQVDTNFADLVSFLNNSVVHRDGSKAMTASFDAGSQKIINLSTGTAGTDAVNKTQLDLKADSTTVDALPRGVVGVATASGTDQTGITSAADITGLSVTFTAVAGRRYRATATYNSTQVTTSGNQTDTLQTDLATFSTRSRSAIASETMSVVHTSSFTTTAGSRTIKARLAADAGTATVVNSFSRNAQLVVEDIGAA